MENISDETFVIIFLSTVCILGLLTAGYLSYIVYILDKERKEFLNKTLKTKGENK